MPKFLMNVILPFFLFIPAFLTAQPQLSINNSTFDFGEIELWQNQPAVFYIENTGNADLVFLPTMAQRDMMVEYPQQRIAPGEQFSLQVYFYTERTGTFEKRAEVYTNASDEPMRLTIKGNIKSIHPSALTACPVMGIPNRYVPHYPVDILVRNSVTKEFIQGAEIDLRQISGNRHQKWQSGPQSNRLDLSVGGYEIFATKEGYSTNQKAFTFSPNIVQVVIELDPLREEVIAQNSPTVERIVTDNPPASTPEQTREEEDWLIEMEAVIPRQELNADGTLSENLYKTNHVIFLLDISISMSLENRFELMQESVNALMKAFRPQDRVTLITYAGRVNTIAENQSGTSKYQLIEEVNKLEPGGVTHGVKGLEVAYETAEKYFIEGGNNQIIIITDGLFNDPSYTPRSLYRTARRQANQNNIILSVVCIGTDESGISVMESAASNGSGGFVHIVEEDFARSALISEVQIRSRIEDRY